MIIIFYKEGEEMDGGEMDGGEMDQSGSAVEFGSISFKYCWRRWMVVAVADGVRVQEDGDMMFKVRVRGWG